MLLHYTIPEQNKLTGIVLIKSINVSTCFSIHQLLKLKQEKKKTINGVVDVQILVNSGHPIDIEKQKATFGIIHKSRPHSSSFTEQFHFMI